MQGMAHSSPMPKYGQQGSEREKEKEGVRHTGRERGEIERVTEKGREGERIREQGR